LTKSSADRATIKTIALAAGVHPSTVSRALTEEGSGRLGEQTVQRIRQLAKELGYEPNPWARSLRTRRTLTIGLVLPSLTESLARMFEGAEDLARERGYQAVTASTRDDEREERRLINGLLDRRVDGLVITTGSTDDPFLDELAARGVPFQLLNRASKDYPSVTVDDELGGFLATRHLLSQGHRRIAFIAGQWRFSSARLRYEGFLQAHKQMRLRAVPELVIESGYDATSGLGAASRVLAVANPPTALFAVNDSVAVGALAAARDLGLRVPDDLAVVGFNDNELSSMLSVPLSSVAIPLEEMGRLSVKLLIDQIEGQLGASVVLQPRLVVRASSRSDRRRDDGPASRE
jgi:LacI family transcriptional regulator